MGTWKTMDFPSVAACFAPRTADSHKGDYGRLLTVCGSYGMAGAAVLCARAALRSGVGLLTVAVPRSVYPLMAAAVPEAVFLPLPETAKGQVAKEAIPLLLDAATKSTAVVVGCGLGTGPSVRAVVKALLREVACPLILDADGINAVTPHTLVEGTHLAPRILTPHPGEMARLLGTDVPAVQANRRELAATFAVQYDAVLALKGHHTLVAAPDGRGAVCPTGNPGMATGGSGDVLAGVIGALAAQGMPPYEAAMCGVYLHGLAGDRAAAKRSQHSMLPSDIVDALADGFLQIEE